MNNKFALSFGISLVIVGLLNIFFETSNIILFGLSVSTTIFSIMNMFEPKISNKKLEQIFNEAKTKNLNIVCTEKDFVKLSDKWQKECFFAKINICFDDENILKIFLI